MNETAQELPSGMTRNGVLVSVVIPTFNGATRIGPCLRALNEQGAGRNVETLVINDGSTDDTAAVVSRYPKVRLISRANAGPAAARNQGANEAHGEILLFTDDDCVPQAGWLDAMLNPFNDPEVVGVKGIYCTEQKQLAARFVQIEYEDKYRLMGGLSQIDFVDTYSAGFRRDRFLEMTGYDTSFPVACAEDVELSYRMSARGWKMIFAPTAVVRHTHPVSFWSYLKKKYKFAFWRVVAVRKNPSKAIKDSHTPQLMKLQLLLVPALITAIVVDAAIRPKVPTTALVLGAFLLSTMSFTLRALRKDPLIGLLSPALLAARACAQMLGVSTGIIYASKKRSQVPAISKKYV